MMKLVTLHLHITSRCFYHCHHCTVDAGAQETGAELGKVDLIRLIDQTVSLRARHFDISGGDPLVLEKQLILDVVSYACQNGLETSINTNGSMLNRQYATQLRAAGLHRMKFSLYGTTPRVNDGFTGVDGSWQKTMTGIRLAKDAGLEVWVNAVFTPQNIEEMLNLPGLLGPLQVDIVQMSSIVPSGRGQNLAEYSFSGDKLAKAIQLVENKLLKPESEKPGGVYYVFTITMFPRPEIFPFPGRYCDIGAGRLVVDSRGNVIPCCLLPERFRYSLGNIREADLRDIYYTQNVDRNPVFAALREGHEKLKERLGYRGISHNLCRTCARLIGKINNQV